MFLKVCRRMKSRESRRRQRQSSTAENRARGLAGRPACTGLRVVTSAIQCTGTTRAGADAVYTCNECCTRRRVVKCRPAPSCDWIDSTLTTSHSTPTTCWLLQFASSTTRTSSPRSTSTTTYVRSHTDPTTRLYTRHVTMRCAKSTGPGCRAPEVQAKK